MDTFSSVYSPDCVLNEQVARQVFELLPDDGPLMVIAGPKGNYWPSDSEAFEKLNISDDFLKQLCAKVDDGTEPLITQTEDFGIVATQLSTENTNCGYLIIAIPNYSPESTLANIALIEILLSLVGLVARLIEMQKLLYERQMRQLGALNIPEADPMLN